MTLDDARRVRLDGLSDYLDRFPCEFRGERPTDQQERAWYHRIGDWFDENSDQVDAEEFSQKRADLMKYVEEILKAETMKPLEPNPIWPKSPDYPSLAQRQAFDKQVTKP